MRPPGGAGRQVGSTASGCANQGLNVAADLAGHAVAEVNKLERAHRTVDPDVDRAGAGIDLDLPAARRRRVAGERHQGRRHPILAGGRQAGVGGGDLVVAVDRLAELVVSGLAALAIPNTLDACLPNDQTPDGG